MGYLLSPGLTFCIASGRTVFLDVRADRYFCLATRADASFAKLVAGAALDPSDTDKLGGLERRGILVSVPSDERPRACDALPVATTSVLDEPETVGKRHILAAAAHLIWSRTLLRCLSLSTLLRWLDRTRTSTHGAGLLDQPLIRRVGWAQHHAGLILSPKDQCLARSLAVANQLARRGCPAKLVMGVRMHPFAAHCWVQAGSALVNETVDEVRNFTPILIV